MKHTCCTILLCLFFFTVKAQVPDDDFGTNGKKIFTYYAEYLEISSLLLQPDGKIVVGGYEYTDEFYFPSIVVWRLNSDGSVDTDFGTGGFVRMRE